MTEGTDELIGMNERPMDATELREHSSPDDHAEQRMYNLQNCPFRVGHEVYKVTGDYTFEGVVVSVFTKLDPRHVRLVVEDDRGILHVYSAKNLALKKEG